MYDFCGLRFNHVFQSSHNLAKPGVAYAPILDGFGKERFDSRVGLRFRLSHKQSASERLAVEIVVLQNLERTEVGAIAQTYVADKGVGRSETESAGTMYGNLLTGIPRDGTLVERLEAWEHAAILHGILILGG